MSRFTPMSKIALSLVVAAAMSACGSDAESREALEDEAVIPAETAQPAAAPQPASQPASQPEATPVRAIPAGTLLTFQVGEDVSTSSHSSGDAFSLTLVDAVSASSGVVLTAGTPARGIVTESRTSTGSDDVSLLAVQVASVEVGGSQKAIEGVVQSAVVEGEAQDSDTRTAATVAIGAAAGAIVGQVVGGNTRSTVIGTAVGTAVGVGVALTTRSGDATLPQGSRIMLQLDQDLVF